MMDKEYILDLQHKYHPKDSKFVVVIVVVVITLLFSQDPDLFGVLV